MHLTSLAAAPVAAPVLAPAADPQPTLRLTPARRAWLTLALLALAGPVPEGPREPEPEGQRDHRPVGPRLQG